MAEQDKRTDIIKDAKSRLERMGYDYDLLPKKEQSYIIAIEEQVQDVFDIERRANEMTAGNNININNMASQIGINRQTIYNHKVLTEYITFCAKEFEKIDSSSLINGYTEEIRRLNSEIAFLRERDVDYMELKLQFKEASDEIDRLKEQLELEQQGISYDFSGKKKRSYGIIKLPTNLKVVTWNVNGLNACADKGFFKQFQKWDADVVCLQETKLQADRVRITIPDYEQYWFFAKKKGYSGTALFCKDKPLNVTNGLGIKRFDDEARIMTAEFNGLYIVNCYSPTSQDGNLRLPFRLEWENSLKEYVADLQKHKPVIICGDLNVAHEETDVEISFAPGSAGIAPEERHAMDDLLDVGFADAFRLLHPNSYHTYSWWPYANNSRENNIGLRLDYFLISETLAPRLNDVKYLTTTPGSDHCPVELTIKRK